MHAGQATFETYVKPILTAAFGKKKDRSGFLKEEYDEHEITISFQLHREHLGNNDGHERAIALAMALGAVNVSKELGWKIKRVGNAVTVII